MDLYLFWQLDISAVVVDAMERCVYVDANKTMTIGGWKDGVGTKCSSTCQRFANSALTLFMLSAYTCCLIGRDVSQ